MHISRQHEAKFTTVRGLGKVGEAAKRPRNTVAPSVTLARVVEIGSMKPEPSQRTTGEIVPVSGW